MCGLRERGVVAHNGLGLEFKFRIFENAGACKVAIDVAVESIGRQTAVDEEEGAYQVAIGADVRGVGRCPHLPMVNFRHDSIGLFLGPYGGPRGSGGLL